jgi:predicted PurR-regulated permease PerM
MVSFAVPEKYHASLAAYFGQISDKISSWVRGQLLVGLIMGVIVYVGLFSLGIKYALIIGLLAALLEFIPFVGPIVIAIPAVILGLTYSPTKAVFVVILFWVANRIENDILIPKIMKHATGLNPVITLIAVAVGFKLGGVLGIILAVPTATALGVLVKNYLEQKAQN